MENTQDKTQILAEIKKLKKLGNFDAMLALAQKATKLFPSEDKVFGFLHDAQAHYVDAKLKSEVVHELEKKGDYLTLQSVYKKLLTVFPESKKLRKLLKDIKAKLEKAHTSESKTYFNGIKKQIRELIAEGRADDAMQICYEVLSQNPGDEEFTHLLEKVQQKMDGQTDQAMDSFFKEAAPALKAEFKSSKSRKDKFVRV